MQVKREQVAFILIAGPTGVGKSACALQIADILGNSEIVNADLGQFYTPLTIGTAKPNWRNEKTPHHGYDILDTPIDYTAADYRLYLQSLCDDFAARGKTPIIVGGSSFYWNCLFFPPQIYSKKTHTISTDVHQICAQDYTWQYLYKVDAVRAQAIHPQDTYRICRAIDIWRYQGILPSSLQPIYDPIHPIFHIIYLTRPRDELYERIDNRVEIMMNEGWIEEVASLDQTWRDFVLRKKIIGYDNIIEYHEGKIHYKDIVSTIGQRTRNYAKRQEIYWRSWKNKLEKNRSRVYSEVVLQRDQEHLTESQMEPIKRMFL